jgi:hypothetical protein
MPCSGSSCNTNKNAVLLCIITLPCAEHTHVQALTAAEASARASKIGIWSADVEAANAKKRGTAAAAAQDTAAHDDAPIADELLPVRLR